MGGDGIIIMMISGGKSIILKLNREGDKERMNRLRMVLFYVVLLNMCSYLLLQSERLLDGN